MNAFICDYIRSPIGRYAGALAKRRPDDLLSDTISELIRRNPSLSTDAIEEVIAGCANQAGEDNRCVARMAVLLSGLPMSVPALTVNRLCASGMDAVALAASGIKAGDGSCYLAGGVESMSRAPFVMGKADAPFSRKAEVFDTTIGWRFINKKLADQYGTESMPETGEEVAKQFNISRLRQDQLAYASQEKYKTAKANGFFDHEIMPISIPAKRGAPVVVSEDEHPRPNSSVETLANLTPLFADGTVTAGNASGVNDGAAMLLLGNAEFADKHQLTPLAEVVAAVRVGVEPKIMGIGPRDACRKLLAKTNLSMDDIDLIEINEAFASQALACLSELGIKDDDPRVNPNGGAIALGHPLGMSGARLIGTLARALAQSGKRYGIATMCVGVGQGVAVLLKGLS